MTRRRNVTEQAATAAIEQGCRMLRLPTIRDRFAEIAAAAEREQLSYLGFLSELVIAECDDRTRRRAERRIRGAGFPRPKRLEEFSFEANPAINPAVIGQLASCAWVKAGHPLCLIGDSGTGKGTVTLIGMSSRAVSFGSAAMDQLWGVDISGGSVERGNLTPDREAIGHHLSVVGRRQQVPTDPEMWRNAAERRQEPLGMPG